MPRQVYRCEVHGEFDELVPFGERPPASAPCPVVLYEGDEDDAGEIEPDSVVLCNEDSPWVPSAPNFIGGPTTGAQKG